MRVGRDVGGGVAHNMSLQGSSGHCILTSCLETGVCLNTRGRGQVV